MCRRPEVTESRDNVFADLGIGGPEEVVAKAELANGTVDTSEDNGVKQAEAAEIVDVARTTLLSLRRGRLSGFSTDDLRGFLNVLGPTGKGVA